MVQSLGHGVAHLSNAAVYRLGAHAAPLLTRTLELVPVFPNRVHSGR
jgi:hypothetical protein